MVEVLILCKCLEGIVFALLLRRLSLPKSRVSVARTDIAGLGGSAGEYYTIREVVARLGTRQASIHYTPLAMLGYLLTNRGVGSRRLPWSFVLWRLGISEHVVYTCSQQGYLDGHHLPPSFVHVVNVTVLSSILSPSRSPSNGQMIMLISPACSERRKRPHPKVRTGCQTV